MDDEALNGYSSGDVLYADSNIKIIAADSLTGKDVSGEGTEYAIYGTGSDDSKVKSSEGNTVRRVLQIDVLCDSADITVIADLNSAKAMEILDSSYTTLSSYTNDGTDKAEKYELTATGLTTGTYYFGGVGTNVYIYGVNVVTSDTETTTETTTEAECPYSFIIDRDLDTSDTYAAGDTVYSDNYITYDAVLKLSVNEGTSSNKIGSYSYANSLVCSSTTSSITLDGTTKSRRIHSSITANQDCILTIATTVPSGKEIAVAQKNSNGTYTSLAHYDGTSFSGNTEIVLRLTAGQTVYIMGQATNPYVYAVDATSAGDANGNHAVELTDSIKILKYIDGLTSLSDTELATSDINNDGAVDEKDVAVILKQVSSIND